LDSRGVHRPQTPEIVIAEDHCDEESSLISAAPSPLILFNSFVSSTFATIHFMDPLRDLGRSLLLFGGFLVLIGALLYFGGKLHFRLGKLPGDIVHRSEHTTFYFPIVTCLVLSAALSLLLWLFSHFRR
jgi:hypothetical protein